ncbi:MAG: 16S rRNA (guanine(527)-N(7))-methyltransferase RsmG [Methylophilaceae bacterium]
MLSNADLLESGINELRIKIPRNLLDNLLIYNNFLVKWNKVFNLTAIRNQKQIFTHHFLDCLAVMPFIKSNSILDVGTGAGFPGIVLALCYPEKQLTLVDAVGKKIAFIKQITGELNLTNVRAIHSRVENMDVAEKFDGVIARAFSEMEILIKLTQSVIASDGYWYGMKSKKIMNNEMDKIDYHWEMKKIKVPYLDAERYLIQVKNSPIYNIK